MKVHRIVANIQAADVAKADAFYQRVLGLKIVMDQGWIRTYASNEKMTVQVSVATEGGSGTPVPDGTLCSIANNVRPNHAFTRTRRYGPPTWPSLVAAGRLTWSC